MGTNKEPTNEQLKGCWEWCGFKYDHWGDDLFIIPPDKSEPLPEPPNLDLNNLYKYAIPKLKELGYGIRLQSSGLRDNDTGKEIFKYTHYAKIFYTRFDKENLHKRWHDNEAFNDKLELAIFGSIYQVITGEQNC